MDYYGFPIRRLANPFFSLDVLETAGPRLVRLLPAGTDLNLLAEVPHLHWTMPAGEFYPLGGHRLWAGPESPELSYLPDQAGARVEEIIGGLRLYREDAYGEVHLARQIDVTLSADAPKALLQHEIQNLGAAPLRLLPWAITQFRLGGRVLLPLGTAPADAGSLLPNRNLVLWPYSRLSDARLHLDDSAVVIDAQPETTPLKVGVYCAPGWTACEFPQGWVLVKRFKVGEPATYADFSSNAQCYVGDAFIELETLGPARSVQPGESVSLVEEWELKAGSLTSLGLI